jgi:hypothetical protein
MNVNVYAVHGHMTHVPWPDCFVPPLTENTHLLLLGVSHFCIINITITTVSLFINWTSMFAGIEFHCTWLNPFTTKFYICFRPLITYVYHDLMCKYIYIVHNITMSWYSQWYYQWLLHVNNRWQRLLYPPDELIHISLHNIVIRYHYIHDMRKDEHMRSNSNKCNCFGFFQHRALARMALTS